MAEGIGTGSIGKDGIGRVQAGLRDISHALRECDADGAFSALRGVWPLLAGGVHRPSSRQSFDDGINLEGLASHLDRLAYLAHHPDLDEERWLQWVVGSLGHLLAFLGA